MLLVVALGDSALLPRGETPDAAVPRQKINEGAAAIAELARDHEVVVTHGNGPQVDLLALQSETHREATRTPLDVLGAESEGMIGYLLEQELGNALPDQDVATLLTQVIVDPADPAFQRPSTPIGPTYSEGEAARLMAERGWAMTPDRDRWRRLVASPVPLEIVELRTIELLVDAGIVVVCAGGGGVPVHLDGAGALRGVEAIVDKDRAAALLAHELGADRLLFLTDASAILAYWGTPRARPIRSATPSGIHAFDFEAGTMAPKVDAACWFASANGRPACIGAVEDASRILAGDAGTLVAHDAGPVTWWEGGTGRPAAE